MVCGMKKMGTFRVGCRVANIADSKKTATVEKLLVDTGSDYTWLPAKVLEKIGVKREKRDIVMTLANGGQITRDVGFVIIRTDNFFTVDEVVFAEPDDLLLLGARTLEGFNARVDSKQKRLVAAGPPLAAANENESGEHDGEGGVKKCRRYCGSKVFALGFMPAMPNEPPHVHVKKDGKHAKFWLRDTIEMEFNERFRTHELNEIRRMIAEG